MQGMDQRMTRVKPLYLLVLSVWHNRVWPLLRRPWLWLPL